MNTTIEPAMSQEILQKLQSLSLEKQQEVLDFVEFLSEKEKAAIGRRSVKGMLSHLNIKVSKAEIDEARHEAWSKFYDDSSSREQK